jgi:hypothetical protein
MRKIKFFAAVLSLIFTQAIFAAEPNESDANSVRSPSHRMRGMHRSERTVINWHDGIQQMAVSMRLTPDMNSLWIFPLKCESSQVKFSQTKNFPQFYGADFRETAANTLDYVNYAVIATQLWTIPLCHFWAECPDSNFGYRSSEVDQNGVHIELLKADSVPELAVQLKERGRYMQETALANYAKYLNKEYSLLAVWRESNEPNIMQSNSRRSHRQRACIYVEFPSEKPSYLMPQKFGGRGRFSLTLTGFWQIAEQEQSKAVQCNQFVSLNANVPDSFKQSLPQKNIPFTTFSLVGESNSVPNELALVSGRLKGTAYTDAVSKMSCLELTALGLAVLAVISYFSAGISGLLIYRKWRGYAELGFANLLSIVAMGIVMNYKKGGIYEAFRQDKWKPRLFLAFFSVIVALLSFALFAMLKMPLK